MYPDAMEALAALIAALALGLAWSARRRADFLFQQNAALERHLGQLANRLAALENTTPVLPPIPPPPPPVTTPVAVLAPTPGPTPRSAPETPDLESIIGSNWLSKLGVLILLIGLALFLGFSLTTLGPTGRIALGLATSIALLGAGIAAERKSDYRVLGAALLGGGWAGLYFTLYAAHALPAARVVDSPLLGLLLLLGASAAMVTHSLRYDAPTITGLAYAAAFLAIAISPPNAFARLSSVPLLATLLAVAWRKNWQPLAAAGAVYAYLACSLNLATGDDDSEITRFGQPILWTYWLLLEGFDLANLRRGLHYFPVFLFNATGFLLAATATWPGGSFGSPEPLLVSIAGAYLLSSLLRLERRPEGYADRSTYYGFCAALTLSTLFAASAIGSALTGLHRLYALALLVQFLALAGWWFRSVYLRWFATALFLLPLGQLLLSELASAAPIRLLGRSWRESTPAAVLLLTLFYANRLALHRTSVYSFAGSFLLAGLIGAEATPDTRPLAATLAAALLWIAARRFDAIDLRLQALLLAILSIPNLFSPPTTLPLLTLGVPAALYLAIGIALATSESQRFALCCAANLFLASLLYRLAPEPHRALACGLAALALWLDGLRRNSWGALAATPVLGFAALGHWQILPANDSARVPALLPYFAILYAPANSAGRYTNHLRILHGATGILLVCLHLPAAAAKGSLTLAYAAVAAALLLTGFLRPDRFSRLTALALLLFCLAKLFLYDFRELDTASRILSFVGLGLLLIGASWIYSGFKQQIRRLL